MKRYLTYYIKRILLGTGCAVFLLVTLNIATASNGGIPLISLTSLDASQDANHYLNEANENNPLLSKKLQKKKAKSALSSYFSPWTLGSNNNYLKSDERSTANTYLKNPRYGLNYHKNPKQWIQRIVDNMNLNSPWTNAQNAIVIHNLNLRALPTNLPIFESYKIAGQGYPFDTLSQSSLWVGEPIKIITLSCDGAWALVEDHNLSGWVNVNDIAYVTNAFIKEYKSKEFAVMTNDNVAIKDNQGNFLFYSRISMLFPKTNNQMMVPIKNLTGFAKLSAIPINHSDVSNFPMDPTPNNFALLMNRMMGEPYGWGGLYLLRDCSLTTQDTLLPFGILLPRNSLYQAKDGKRIMLTGLTVSEKRNYILRHAVPFFTLVHLPGHVALYIGNKNGDPIIFQNKWGLHTNDKNGNEGRAVIGKADITSLSLGANAPSASKTLLDSANSITILN